MERPRYQVVITDCDHGSVDEEKEEFDGKSNAQNGKCYLLSPRQFLFGGVDQ